MTPTILILIFVAGVLVGLAVAKLIKTLVALDRECAIIIAERAQ